MLLTHVWLAPSVLMLVIGRWRIGRPGLWPDELATVNAATLPVKELLRLVREIDAVDAPYYLVMHGWVKLFGVSEVAIRLPSLLVMAAAAGATALLGRRLFNSELGLLAGLLFAVHPITARYGQEARAYAFTILFAVLATLVLTYLLARPTWWSVLGYAACLAGMGLFHLMSLFLVAGHAVAVGIWWWSHRPSRTPWWWLGATGIGLAAVAPQVWLGYSQKASASWIREPQARQLLAAIDGIHGSGVVAGVLLGVALLGWRNGWKQWMLASWAVVPVLALYAVSITVLPLYYTRYLLFTAPALVLLAAAGLSGRFRLGLLVVLAVAVVGVPQQLTYRAPDGHRYDTRAAAALINRNFQPGDGIAYALNEPVIPWGARDLVARYVRPDRQPTDVFAVSPQRVDGHFLAEECADADLTACLGDTQRLWVIRYRTLTDPLVGIGPAKEAVLRERYALSKLWLVTNFTVALYQRRQ
jgi:mannosyltransferase